MKPDLKFIFGGVSKRLITKADCSIHIVRGEQQGVTAPIKLLVGIDNSYGVDL